MHGQPQAQRQPQVACAINQTEQPSSNKHKLPSYHSFIHVTPVAEAHLSNASPFQTPLITPNNKRIKPTNKDNFLPG
jgi:hypothetical protein